jgi:hypothetical protein
MWFLEAMTRNAIFCNARRINPAAVPNARKNILPRKRDGQALYTDAQHSSLTGVPANGLQHPRMFSPWVFRLQHQEVTRLQRLVVDENWNRESVIVRHRCFRQVQMLTLHRDAPQRRGLDSRCDEVRPLHNCRPLHDPERVHESVLVPLQELDPARRQLRGRRHHKLANKQTQWRVGTGCFRHCDAAQARHCRRKCYSANGNINNGSHLQLPARRAGDRHHALRQLSQGLCCLVDSKQQPALADLGCQILRRQCLLPRQLLHNTLFLKHVLLAGC